MHLSPVPPLNNSQIYVSGDVTINPQATIAPGAILQAAPNSKIVINAGVCIGMGVIVQAYQGTIAIESGAILGAGVLVVGQGKIGANACIGSATTIYHTCVAAQAVISPGSLIGDTSRQLVPEVETPESPVTPSEESAPEQNGSSPDSSPPKKRVYGKVYVNSLLMSLFPEGHSLNRPPSTPE